MKESLATLNLRKALNDYGWFVKVSDRYIAGIPDIIGVCHGQFISIEMKIDGNEPTPLQKMSLAAIESRGGLAFVCIYRNDVKEYFITYHHSVWPREFNGDAKGVADWILKLIASRTKGSAGV